MAEAQRRVVRGSLRGEQPTQTTEVLAQDSILSSVAASLLRLVSQFWTELLIVLTPVALWWSVMHFVSVPTGMLAIVILTMLVVECHPVRRFLLRRVRHSRLRRQWNRACRFTELVTHNDHVPLIEKVTDVPAGDRLQVQIRSGSTVTKLEDSAEQLAACLNVREVRVERESSSARQAWVTVVRRDAFEDHGPLQWPFLGKLRTSMWDPVPLAIDELGRTISVLMIEQNLLVGGLPGGGKSVALSLLAATAALDSETRLTVIDGKDVELVAWNPVAEHFCGSDVKAANGVLLELQAEMQRRYDYLKRHGKRKVERGDGLPLHVVIIDELASFLLIGDKDDSKAFARLSQDLVSRGRAAGIIVVAATQKPASETVPTGLRDLFSLRWALRCSTPQASDTILGQGWATQGFSAAELGENAPKGVGLLLHESGSPTRCRSFHLSDAELHQVADQAKLLRATRPPNYQQLKAA